MSDANFLQVPWDRNKDHELLFDNIHSIYRCQLQLIDNALIQYYTRLSITNYRDGNGMGLFFNEFKDRNLSVEEVFGDYADPNDYNYTQLGGKFPIPPYMHITDDQRNSFIFYIIQYCYKYNKPPSDKYIKKTLIPKCHGGVRYLMDYILGIYFVNC
eukprot:532385_1